MSTSAQVLSILVLLLAAGLLWRSRRPATAAGAHPSAPEPGPERRLLDSLNPVPWEWDLQEGRYTFVGRRIEDLFGYPVERWTGANFWLETLHPADVERVEQAFMQAVWTHGAGRYRYRATHADGRPLQVETRIVTVPVDGAPRYVCGTTGLAEDAPHEPAGSPPPLHQPLDEYERRSLHASCEP